MTDIDRPLTTPEREVMLRLAVNSIAAQTGNEPHHVAASLNELAQTGEIVLQTSPRDAFLTNQTGVVIVHAERDWLAFAANHGIEESGGECCTWDERRQQRGEDQP